MSYLAVLLASLEAAKRIVNHFGTKKFQEFFSQFGYIPAGPGSEFIAGFVGHVNFLEGRIEKVDPVRGGASVATSLGVIDVTPEGRDVRVGDRVTLVIRPEAIRVSPDRRGLDAPNVFEGSLESSMYLGSLFRYVVRINGERVIVDQANPRAAAVFASGKKVFLAIPPSIHLLGARR